MGDRKSSITYVVCDYPNVKPRDLLHTYGDVRQEIDLALGA